MSGEKQSVQQIHDHPGSVIGKIVVETFFIFLVIQLFDFTSFCRFFADKVVDKSLLVSAHSIHRIVDVTDGFFNARVELFVIKGGKWNNLDSERE